MLFSLETTVVDWSKNVNRCLEETLETAVPHVEFPLPIHEYEFWNNRLKALQNIYSQLVHPDVRKMVIILEENNSDYITIFRKLFERVVEGTSVF